MHISVRTAKIVLKYLERSIPRGREEEEDLAQAIRELHEQFKPKKGTR